MKLAAAKTSALLSLLFIGVYATCSWITAHRSDVGTWFFDWERHIPFVPLMILPYMSIDLFFVAAPFLCRSRQEMRLLARRIAFVIVVAGLCFLLFPLRFAFPRPQPEGWLGAIFGFLHGFDAPYNLFPSLHIALRTILADLYFDHTRGGLRVLTTVWFSLIGFSTVLTYQHHVVDVLGGFALAVLCFYMFRAETARPPISPNRRIGARYAIASAATGALAFLAWPWTAILLWPSLSLGVVACAYLGVGPVIFRKENGRLPFASRLLLGPCLLGQFLSWRYYRSQCDAWNEITPTVWIGARLSEPEAADAVRRGITAVLDLTAEFNEARSFCDVLYRNIPILDLTGPTTGQLRDAVEFIEQHAGSGKVYVHCKIGYSRSAAVVGAWLLATNRAGSVDDAFGQLRRVRPGIVIRPEAREAMERFANAVMAA